MGKKGALLIGVTDYRGKSDLVFCEDDVKLMDEVLRLKGFACEVLLNPHLREEALGAVKALRELHSESEDILLVYFSCHGGEALGEQFLQGPRQAGPSSVDDLLKNGDFLRLSEVLDELSHSSALKLVVVDACRSSWIFQQNEIEGYYAGVAKQRRNAHQHITNCVVAFACAEGKKSSGDDGIGSQFTVVLSKELRNYSQDFLQVVQRATASLIGSSIPQIPWFYSSTLITAFPDRLSLSHEMRKPLIMEKTPRAFIGHSEGEIVGIARDSLVKLTASGWEKVTTLDELGDAVDVSFSIASSRLVWLRRKSLYWSDASLATGSFRRVRAADLDHVFGVKISPDGKAIAAYGYAKGDVSPGLCLWHITGSMNITKVLVEELPDLQCNACEWIDQGSVVAAFSNTESGKTFLYKMTRQSTGAVTAVAVGRFDSRVTTMVAGESDVVWLGDVEGHITRYDLESESTTPIKRSHPLNPSMHGCRKKWLGRGAGFLEHTLAVASLAWDNIHKVLGVQFYDGTMSFIDGMAAVQIEAVSAPAFCHKLAITSSHTGLFYTLGEVNGQVHRILQ